MGVKKIKQKRKRSSQRGQRGSDYEMAEAEDRGRGGHQQGYLLQRGRGPPRETTSKLQASRLGQAGERKPGCEELGVSGREEVEATHLSDSSKKFGG